MSSETSTRGLLIKAVIPPVHSFQVSCFDQTEAKSTEILWPSLGCGCAAKTVILPAGVGPEIVASYEAIHHEKPKGCD